MYNPLLYAFLVGALLPILLWSYLRRVRVVVCISPVLLLPTSD
jgi:hypothetical protein